MTTMEAVMARETMMVEIQLIVMMALIVAQKTMIHILVILATRHSSMDGLEATQVAGSIVSECSF